MNPEFVFPVGTQVVTEIDITGTNGEILFTRGAVGVIVKSPLDNQHTYRVRFPNDYEAVLKHGHFTVRSQHQGAGLRQGGAAAHNLFDFVIYRCVVGSRAYGLADDNSDTDRRGIYLPPADLQWSLAGVPEQLDNPKGEEHYWELEKFIVLALKANPNVLECLYTPLVEMTTPLADELLDMRSIFVSKLIYQTYNGYVLSQFKKLNKDIQNYGTMRWKHAMHLIRLLLAGIVILDEGYVPVLVQNHREDLLAIRRGEMTWDAINAWRLQLHEKFDHAFKRTQLPERPNYEAANTFLIKARRKMVSN